MFFSFLICISYCLCKFCYVVKPPMLHFVLDSGFRIRNSRIQFPYLGSRSHSQSHVPRVGLGALGSDIFCVKEVR